MAYGVCNNSLTHDELVEFSRDVENGSRSIDSEAVRYYSATYGTFWEGKEGELVAESLVKLANGDSPSAVYRYVAWEG